MSNFSRYTVDKHVLTGKMAKYSANICEFVAAEFDDDYKRVFWCTSFNSPDWEHLVYHFTTDYNERFAVHFNFNNLTTQVIYRNAKGEITIKKFFIEPTLSFSEVY